LAEKINLEERLFAPFLAFEDPMLNLVTTTVMTTLPAKLPSTTNTVVLSSLGAATVAAKATGTVAMTWTRPPSISTSTMDTFSVVTTLTELLPLDTITGAGATVGKLGAAGAGAAVDATAVVTVVVVTIGAVDPEKAGSLTTLSGREDSDVARRPLRRVVEERGTHSLVAKLYLSQFKRRE